MTHFSITPPQPLQGALALNTKLNNAEKLFFEEIKGPEHLEVHNGVLYTTLDGGYVVKIVDDKVVPVVKFGKKCGKSLFYRNVNINLIVILNVWNILLYNCCYVSITIKV